MNLTGSVDLLKLEKAGVTKINGVECIVIPIKENDLYVSRDESQKAKGVFLNLNISQRREPSVYGKTHYSKQNFSKDFREANDIRNKPYLGDFKEFIYGGSSNNNSSESSKSPARESSSYSKTSSFNTDDLPF